MNEYERYKEDFREINNFGTSIVSDYGNKVKVIDL